MVISSNDGRRLATMLLVFNEPLDGTAILLDEQTGTKVSGDALWSSRDGTGEKCSSK